VVSAAPFMSQEKRRMRSFSCNMNANRAAPLSHEFGA
jgi:hypothetical protein